MKRILQLALLDFKIIFRTPLLKSFLLLPLLLFAMVLWFLPSLLENYPHLRPYLNIFIIVAVVENTQMFSFISSMVLLEEKESGISKAYGIVPLRNRDFILARFLVPYLFTVGLNITLLCSQALFPIDLIDTVAISTLCGLVVPIYAMCVASLAKNRMQGMIFVKVLNILVLVPIIVYFIPERFSDLFTVFPTYWIFTAVDQIIQGNPIRLIVSTGFIFLYGLGFLISIVFKKRYVS